MAKIGIFDSGIGGFSILKEVEKRLPLHDYYYFSDDAHSPYGPKNVVEIQDRMSCIISELEDHSIDLIIVACNTATLAGIDAMRKQFPHIPFVGVEPYVNAIHKEAKRRPLSKPALLLTQASFHSSRFSLLTQKIQDSQRIKPIVLPQLASLIEKAYWKGLNKRLKNEIINELKPLIDYSPSHVILACTHYSLVKKLIEDKTNANCITPCQAVARRVSSLIDSLPKSSIPSPKSKDFLFKRSSLNTWEMKGFDELGIQ